MLPSQDCMFPLVFPWRTIACPKTFALHLWLMISHVTDVERCCNRGAPWNWKWSALGWFQFHSHCCNLIVDVVHQILVGSFVSGDETEIICIWGRHVWDITKLVTFVRIILQLLKDWVEHKQKDHVNANQLFMLYFLKSPLASLWQLYVHFGRVQAGSWYRLQWTFTQSHFQSIDDFLENVWSCFPPAGSVWSCQDSFGKAPLQSWLSLLAMGFCWWQFCRVSR